jgi:hypothetical protein
MLWIRQLFIWFVMVCPRFYRKNRNFLSAYLIRLTRGYTDGGMDSRSEGYKGTQHKEIHVYCYHQQPHLSFRANVRSAVHVSMGEAGVTFAQNSRFLRKTTKLFFF